MTNEPISISVVIQDGDPEVALMGALQQVMAHFSKPLLGADSEPTDTGMRERAADWLADRYDRRGQC